MPLRRLSVLSIAIALCLIVLSEGKKHMHAATKHHDDILMHSSLAGLTQELQKSQKEEEEFSG
jgi:hypothetical protein